MDYNPIIEMSTVGYVNEMLGNIMEIYNYNIPPSNMTCVTTYI